MASVFDISIIKPLMSPFPARPFVSLHHSPTMRKLREREMLATMASRSPWKSLGQEKHLGPYEFMLTVSMTSFIRVMPGSSCRPRISSQMSTS